LDNFLTSRSKDFILFSFSFCRELVSFNLILYCSNVLFLILISASFAFIVSDRAFCSFSTFEMDFLRDILAFSNSSFCDRDFFFRLLNSFSKVDYFDLDLTKSCCKLFLSPIRLFILLFNVLIFSSVEFFKELRSLFNLLYCSFDTLFSIWLFTLSDIIN
jgi:hypothetical protein